MPTFISFPSLKGGVGKSATAILVANYLAAARYKVLVIDLDMNNSLTFYYLMEENALNTQNKNIAKAMYDDGKIDDNIIQTKKTNIFIIPSSLNLADLRAIDTNRLKKKIKESSRIPEFDFVLFDNPPTYDNIVISSMKASDLIITPVNFDQFNFNTTKFLEYKILEEIPEKISSWYLLFNGFNEQASRFPQSIQSQITTLFRNNFSNIIDINIPKSGYIRKYIDAGVSISRDNKQTKKVWNAYDALGKSITEDVNLDVGVF